MANLNNLKTTVLVSSSVTSSVLDTYAKKSELGDMAYQNDVDKTPAYDKDATYARKQGKWVEIEIEPKSEVKFYTGLCTKDNLELEDFSLLNPTNYVKTKNYSYRISEEIEDYIWWCCNYPVESVNEVIGGTVQPAISLYEQPEKIYYDENEFYCYRCQYKPAPGTWVYRITVNNEN